MKKYIIILVVCLLSACGTDTGSPSANIGGGDQAILSLPVVACEKINECEGYDLASCTNDFYLLDNIDSEIGLTPGDYADFNAVRRDVVDRILVEDASASLTCIDEVRNLSCALPAVDAAYDPILANPLQNLQGMLPASCSGIFQ